MNFVTRLLVTAIIVGSLQSLVACSGDPAEFFGAGHAGGECSTRAIDDEYLIQFKDLRGLQKVRMPATRIPELLERKDIRWIEPNYAIAQRIRSVASQSVLNGIGEEYAWRRGFYGQGIPVAIVDSGVEMDHPRLRGKIRSAWNLLENSANVRDESGHGTHIAGIIAASRPMVYGFGGIAPEAPLIVADFMSGDRGDEYHAIKGVEYALKEGAKIINNSWSNFCSYSIRDSFSRWQKLNVIFVNAAGNDGLLIDRMPIFPSNMNLANTVTVGSVDSGGRLSSFSNYGHNVVTYAPGEEIFSLTNRESGLDVLVARSGTSMSTAFVSGALALVWSARPELSAAEIVRALKARAPETYSRRSTIDVGEVLRSLD